MEQKRIIWLNEFDVKNASLVEIPKNNSKSYISIYNHFCYGVMDGSCVKSMNFVEEPLSFGVCCWKR